MLIIYEPFAHGNSSLSSRAKVQIWLKVVTSQERKAEERVRKGPATESVVQRKGQMEVRGTPRSSTVSRGWRQSSLGEESMGGPGVTHQPSLQPPAPGEFESASSFLCQVPTYNSTKLLEGKNGTQMQGLTDTLRKLELILHLCSIHSSTSFPSISGLYSLHIFLSYTTER